MDNNYQDEKKNKALNSSVDQIQKIVRERNQPLAWCQWLLVRPRPGIL
jgi:hypothetical protein